MKAPGFWYRPPGLLSTLLSPLGTIYAAGTARRLTSSEPKRLDCKVICVGNINVGGTGKTPTVIALIAALRSRDFNVAVVTRGYGGALEGPVEITARHRAEDVGDEPLLLSSFAPVWMAKNRMSGAEAAIKSGADLLITDDGFQDPSLQKDLSIVVVDAERGFGNSRVLPAGPLREPVETGLARADLLLSVGSSSAQNQFKKTIKDMKIPHLTGSLEVLETGMDWRGKRVLAFAGIGNPSRFFRTLETLGCDVAKTLPLDDHQVIGVALLARLEREASALGAQLVTTEKDAVRLPSEFRPKVLALPVRLRFHEPDEIERALVRLRD